MVFVTMPVKVANQMLRTEFGSFRSLTRRDLGVLRITKPYFLPEEVAKVVSMVDDIMRFPALREAPKAFGSELTADDEFSSCGTKCNGYTTPDVLKKAYSFDTVKSVATGNSMSVAEFQLQYCK
jgi:hypothetical protein